MNPKSPLLISQTSLDELIHFGTNFRPAGATTSIKFNEAVLPHDPFNAYIEVEFGGQVEKYLIFRNYTPLEFKPKDSSIEYASYMSPMGQLAARPAGFHAPVARRVGTLQAKARFLPRRGDGSWDGFDPEVEWGTEKTVGPSLRQLISRLTASAATGLKHAADEDLIPVEIKLVSRRSVVQVTELPDQAILDEVQDPIFRHSLSGSILITGAPGTGKTTVQVKRLAQKTKWEFLTDAERTGLDRSTWHENEGWIFFTPTQLLKSYLKEALAKERLAASDSNVKVWQDYHLELLRRVRFLKVNKDDDGFLRTVEGVRHLKETNSQFCTQVADQCFTRIRDQIDDHVRKLLRLPAGYARPITRIADLRAGLSKEERKKLGYAGLFRQIPEAFRAFRELPEIRQKFYVNDAITDPGFRASRIDPQESAILLYVALRWVRETWGSFENDDTRANTGGPAYLLQDQQLIVAIDEATDFSAVELASMGLLADPIRESVSLSGDLMQRLTTTGIMSWDELDLIAPKIPRFNLRRAYRQTDRLTKTANKLYSAFSGENVPITDPINRPHNDSPVLAVQKASPAEAAEWIGSRIQEIFDLNGGKLPSVGVLVPSESEVEPFSARLREALFDSSIDVEASLRGQSLGTASKVRVFCVDHIKGLEFESVFFCDIDRMAGHQADLVDKFVYVGLSRARSYLGMTFRETLPAKLEVIRDELCAEDRFFPESSLKTWRHYVDEEDLKEFTSEEQSLLDQHFKFYWELSQGTRAAETDRQKAFMKMSQLGSAHKPVDGHERAFRRFLDLRASEKTL